MTTVGGPVTRLAAYRDGSHAAVILADGSVAVVDLDAAEVVGTAALEGATDLAAVDDVTALLVLPAVVEDPEAAAAKLAEILGGEPATYLADLTRVEEPNVRIDAVTTIEERTALKAAMDAGPLAGVELQPVSTMAVADGSGVTFLDVAAATTARVELEGGAAGLAQVSGVDEGTQVYATSTDAATGDAEITVISITGDRAENGPEEREDFPLPGSGTRVVFDAASELVYVLGTTPDGTGTTVYVVEPHGKSVFADHRLPFAPTALVLDHNKDFPTTSHGSLLPFAAGGEAVSLDVGSYTFAWRMPGVIMGALTVAVLFLLARILFRRRSVAVLVGLFALLDGMLFVQSRIAMNDVYTAFFILAAYLLFAWLWLEPERVKRSFWLVHARHGRPPGPGTRLQVGRRLCDRRARDPRADPFGPRPGPADRRHDRDHRRPRLDGSRRPGRQRRGREPPVHPDHDRPHAGDGGADRLSTRRLVGRRDALRRRGAGRRGDPDRLHRRWPWAARRTTSSWAPSSSRRSRRASRSCWSACWPTPRSTSAGGSAWDP